MLLEKAAAETSRMEIGVEEDQRERKLKQLQKELAMVEKSFSHCLKELQLRDMRVTLTQPGVEAMHFPTPYRGNQGLTTSILTTDPTKRWGVWRQLFHPGPFEYENITKHFLIPSGDFVFYDKIIYVSKNGFYIT